MFDGAHDYTVAVRPVPICPPAPAAVGDVAVSPGMASAARDVLARYDPREPVKLDELLRQLRASMVCAVAGDLD